MEVTLYTRERGPVCYAMPLFGHAHLLGERAQQLLSSGVAWRWVSARTRAAAEPSARLALPEERGLTSLTHETASSLIDDLTERDVDGYGRTILLVGSDASAAAGSPAEFEDALWAFSDREEAPVRAVIVQIGDSPDEHMFLPHEPSHQLIQLLRLWGTFPPIPCKVRPYDELRLASLESALRSLRLLLYAEA